MIYLLTPTVIKILMETVLLTRLIPMTIMTGYLTAKMTSLKIQPKQMTLMEMVLVIIKTLMMTMMDIAMLLKIQVALTQGILIAHQEIETMINSPTRKK